MPTNSSRGNSFPMGNVFQHRRFGVNIIPHSPLQSLSRAFKTIGAAWFWQVKWKKNRGKTSPRAICIFNFALWRTPSFQAGEILLQTLNLLWQLWRSSQQAERSGFRKRPRFFITFQEQSQIPSLTIPNMWIASGIPPSKWGWKPAVKALPLRNRFNIYPKSFLEMKSKDRLRRPKREKDELTASSFFNLKGQRVLSDLAKAEIFAIFLWECKEVKNSWKSALGSIFS